MMVEAIYASTNPTCDMLNLYDQATLIARIHDQLWIEHVLAPQQRTRWYNGEYIFDVSSKAIDEHCETRYAR
jgi:regulation of enolase protein 1 (concanavalin A-like superfamily)